MNEIEKEIYDKVEHYLNVIFLDDNAINLLQKDVNFQDVIINDISICEILNNPNTDRFINSYKSITKKEFKINPNIKNISNDEKMDMINYTNIYILNTLKLSIDQLDKCKTNNINNNNDDVIDIDQQNESNNFGNAQSDEDIIKNSGFSMHDVADQLLATQANMLLNKNIMNGKIYIFNSKPKIIPIIKIIVIALMSIMLLLSIVAFALVASQNGILKINSENGTSEIGVNVVTYVFQFIIDIIILFFISSSMFRNFKNDNNKYKFSWGWMCFYIIIFLFSTFMFSWEILINKNSFIDKLKANSSNWDNNTNNWINNDVQTAVTYLTVYAANIEIGIFAIIALLLFITIIGGVCNPKRDTARLQQLLNQYMMDIRNGLIDTESINGSTGIFDGPFGPNGWF